jgi:putative spermidine/putrescine transport system permease protein
MSVKIGTATAELAAGRSFTRRLAVGLDQRPRLRLALLLGLPILALVVVYFGSLLTLLLNAFWTRDTFTGFVVPTFNLDNFAELAKPLFVTVTLRTVTMAAAVTVTCAVIAFPIAYYMARVASPTLRGALVVAVLTPLWASYLIKIYSWKLMLSEEGVLNWLLQPLGLHGPGFGEIGLWLVFTYLWLPYMILPIVAGLGRIPSSVLEASADLGGRGWRTFRHVVLPLAFPAVVAGSIFTFSLTLGDYIAPGQIASGKQFIGNLILANFGTPDLPLAAAQALVPLAIMVSYLLIARRLGAFEAL